MTESGACITMAPPVAPSAGAYITVAPTTIAAQDLTQDAPKRDQRANADL